MDLITKICTNCWINKNLSEFYKGSNKFGLSHLCKECSNITAKARRISRRDRPRGTEPKVCSRCRVLKEISEFYACTGSTDGWGNNCKDCASWYAKEERRAHATSMNEYLRTYRKKNADKLKISAKIWRENNLERIYSNRKRKYDNNPQFKLRNCLRNRIRAAIQGKVKAGSAVRDLGCTVPEAIAYLESKFLPGMTWQNWSLDGWHVDHVIPVSKFDLTDREQFLAACHYTNLQPMWAKDNLIKSDGRGKRGADVSWPS